MNTKQTAHTPTPRKPRDMSKAQVLAALKRNGMEPCGFMGYVTVRRTETRSVQVSRYNAGKRYRDQLAYLLAEQEKANARAALAKCGESNA